MFTGIITDLGKVKAIALRADHAARDCDRL